LAEVANNANDSDAQSWLKLHSTDRPIVDADTSEKYSADDSVQQRHR